VSDDAVGGPVEQGPGPQARRLHPTEAALDDHHALVAEGGVLRGQGVVVGGEDALAVEALLPLDLGLVDLEAAPTVSPEVLAEATRGQQLTDPLGMGLLGLASRRGRLIDGRFAGLVDRLVVLVGSTATQRRDLGPKQFQEPLPVALLPGCFLEVAAEQVASATLAVAHHHLLDLEVGAHLAVAAGTSQHLLLDLLHLPHRHGQDIAAQPLAQRLLVLRRVHPGIADEDAAAKAPAS